MDGLPVGRMGAGIEVGSARMGTRGCLEGLMGASLIHYWSQGKDHEGGASW